MAHILVIDDDPQLQRMVGLIIERAGHHAILAKDTPGGLEIAASGHPDLVILDIMMPGASGHEVARQLRTNPQTAHIPILILTARAQAMDRAKALAAGADAFLAKPVTADALMAKVRALLNIRAGAPAPAPTPPTPSPPTMPVTVILGLRGGAGSTTIAVNLALALARQEARVCLVDLSPFSGHAALSLHIVPPQSWAGFLGMEAGPSTAEVKHAVVTHKASGVGILPAPQVPPLHTLSERAAARILAALLQDYAHLVVDASTLGAASRAVLRVARTVILPMNDDILSIQTTTGTFSVLRAVGVKAARIRVVLNHVRPEAHLSADAVQKAIKRPLDAVLPYAPTQHMCVAQGIPLIEAHPDCAFATSIADLARTL